MGAETSLCGMTWLQAPPFTAEVRALVRADTHADTSSVQAAGGADTAPPAGEEPGTLMSRAQPSPAQLSSSAPLRPCGPARARRLAVAVLGGTGGSFESTGARGCPVTSRSLAVRFPPASRRPAPRLAPPGHGER